MDTAAVILDVIAITVSVIAFAMALATRRRLRGR